MNKLVLVDVSNTQRVTIELVTVKGEHRVEIRKEYRRLADNACWRASKGITIPMNNIPKLVAILKEISNKEVNGGE